MESQLDDNGGSGANAHRETFTKRRADHTPGFCDPNGILPAQFFQRSSEATGEEKMWYDHVELSCDDWKRIMRGSRVRALGSHEKFTLEDGEELALWLFDDGYGEGDEYFVSFRQICKSLQLDINDIRARLLEMGTLKDLPHKLAPREERHCG